MLNVAVVMGKGYYVVDSSNGNLPIEWQKGNPKYYKTVKQACAALRRIKAKEAYSGQSGAPNP